MLTTYSHTYGFYCLPLFTLLIKHYPVFPSGTPPSQLSPRGLGEADPTLRLSPGSSSLIIDPVQDYGVFGLL